MGFLVERTPCRLAIAAPRRREIPAGARRPGIRRRGGVCLRRGVKVASDSPGADARVARVYSSDGTTRNADEPVRETQTGIDARARCRCPTLRDRSELWVSSSGSRLRTGIKTMRNKAASSPRRRSRTTRWRSREESVERPTRQTTRSNPASSAATGASEALPVSIPTGRDITIVRAMMIHGSLSAPNACAK